MNARHELIRWAVFSAVLLLFVLCASNSPTIAYASFFLKLCAFVVGVLFGAVGGVIGNVIRWLVRPDFIVTDAGMATLLWRRVFWSIGLQVIGAAGSSLFCLGLLLR